MNNHTASKVPSTELEHPAATPIPMRQRAVNESQPEDDEDAVGPESHSVDESSRSQCWCNAGEHALVCSKKHPWDTLHYHVAGPLERPVKTYMLPHEVCVVI